MDTEILEAITKFGKFTFTENRYLHSTGDKPALVYPNGYRAHYMDGKKHRDIGPAVITSRGILKFYRAGKLHAEDGPAIIYPSGAHVYLVNGKIHNTNGPALVSHSGRCYWFVNGRRMSKEDFNIKFPNND